MKRPTIKYREMLDFLTAILATTSVTCFSHNVWKPKWSPQALTKVVNFVAIDHLNKYSGMTMSGDCFVGMKKVNCCLLQVGECLAKLVPWFTASCQICESVERNRMRRLRNSLRSDIFRMFRFHALRSCREEEAVRKQAAQGVKGFHLRRPFPCNVCRLNRYGRSSAR